jgi:hypothetical protein
MTKTTLSKSEKSREAKKPQDKEQNHAEAQAKAQLESIKEMVAALNQARDNDDTDAAEEAEQTIHEDPLSVEVRTDWYTLDQDSDKKPAFYRILLCWGGPACQVVGDLSEYGEPETAKIEYQDWGTPWTEYRLNSEEENIVLTYARCFYYGEG